MRKYCSRVLAILVACAMFSGCVSKVDGQLLVSNAYQGEFFVERQPNDSRNLNKNISEVLTARGIKASYGEPGDAPESAEYIVTYIDRWQWDMRMYLSSLRIEAREKSTSQIVGYGESGQSSLASMGKSFDDIVNRTLDQMLVK